MDKSNKRKRPNRDYGDLLDICETLIPDIEDALALILTCEREAQVKFIDKWLRQCDANVRTLNNILLNSRLSTDEQQRCLSLIQQALCVRTHLDVIMKRGEGMSNNDVLSNRVQWKECDTAFKRRLQTGIIVNLVHKDIAIFLEDAFILFEERVRDALNRHGAIKVYAVLGAKFKKILNEKEAIELKHFIAKTNEIYPTTILEDWFNKYIKEPILKGVEQFQETDSDWSLHSIIKLEININKYNPIRASSYIDLPIEIKRKKACVNVQNADNQCFKWAVLSALHPASSHSQRVSNYIKYADELNFTGIDFPVASKCIFKFEKQNDISVNVYSLVRKNWKFTTIPIHLTSQKKGRHVNLLRVEDHYVNENDDSDDYEDDAAFESLNFHYVWIKDLSRLVSNQLSRNGHRAHICDRCLHYFTSEEKLIKHIEDCKKLNHCKINLPKLGKNVIEFKNYSNKEKVPFIIYADCECLLKPVAQDELPKRKTKTEISEKHELIDIGYFLKCSYDDSLSKYYSCPDGEDPAKWFTGELRKLSEDVETVFMCPIPMNQLTTDQNLAYNNATICHMCEKSINPEEKKVRDHCHLTGRYRGPAHEECNLNYQDSRTIPVVFHNLSGYDAHFIIRDICTQFDGKVDLLPINKERYIAFTKHVKGSEIKFRFIDSFRFMASSLEKLASYLTEYKIVKSMFPNLNDDKIKLLTRKGILPYEYLDSKDKLKETQLPSKDKFYSKLNDSTVSDEDYEHARRVWSEFNCQSLGDYVKLYLKTDVLLLADIFENFREQCLNAYKLDPAHYYTTPGLTWDAMLKYTKIKLELLTDIDKLIFIELGIRGGISQCCNRYAKANNQFMEVYDENQEIIYIVYFDANNLYGWAMTQALPYSGFEWIPHVDNNFDFNVPNDSPIGYILEVDLDYPAEIHDTHSDFPFCAESSKPPGSSQKKLLTTLLPKRKYILHYRALKQALSNGLKLVKIHRVLKFNQSAWLQPYIDFNTLMRANAKNEFEKNLFKLMNNAVYGKTMENVRKHVDIKLVTKWESRYGAEALISKPNFQSRSIFSENLVAVELRKTEILFNKPIYVGLSVLDISKTLIYDFHYDYMLPKYHSNCKLLYTDTDSLVYEVKCPNIYADMKHDIEKFDTSDYPANNVFDMPQANKKVVGLMKDECSGKIVTEFVGLRSKMYSLRVEGQDGQDIVKKAKGIKAGVVENTIGFNDYIDCLQNVKTQARTQYIIRSRLHNVETVKQLKIALSPHDDKRYLLSQSTDTLAWGHYRIKEIEELKMDVDSG